jgi:anaerobic ribonucleoside-triphosphate reductase activating protein
VLVERVFYPVSTLGPGERIGIWTSGCSKKCFNCISPEMWIARTDKDINVNNLINFVNEIITKNNVDGITISGGDPLEQPDDILRFVSKISRKCRDILIYTGYTLSELYELWPEEKINLLLAHTAVLIDGRYVDDLNDGRTPLIGSTNQKIHYFNPNIKPEYDEYMRLNGRQVQNVYYNKKMISIGIHNKEPVDGN